MTKTLIYSVAVHSCLMPKDECLHTDLKEGRKYLFSHTYVDKEGKAYQWYRMLPKKCTCRQFITMDDANTRTIQGVAQVVWRRSKNGPTEDTKAIWMAQQRQVPRVDLISRTDIERAYIDHIKSSIEYIEEVHQMYMKNRLKLIVPFQEDPQEGRLLFPFASDDRTSGGVHRFAFRREIEQLPFQMENEKETHDTN